jgi:hypothetical protein
VAGVARRVDRVAQWIAADILRAYDVPRSPGAMGAAAPLAYKLADAVLAAVGEIVGEIAAELAKGVVPAVGDQVTEMDIRVWETELASSGPLESE